MHQKMEALVLLQHTLPGRISGQSNRVSAKANTVVTMDFLPFFTVLCKLLLWDYGSL